METTHLEEFVYLAETHNLPAGLKLTEEGEVFYRDARVILRDCASALEHVEEVRSTNANVVRIGYLRNAARPVIVYFVRYMQKKHPGLRLALSCMEYNELRRAIEDGTVDIAIGVNVSPEISRHYRSTHIYTDRFFIVMSKDNPIAKTIGVAGLRLADLPNDKLLMPDSFVFSGLSEFIERLMAKQNQDQQTRSSIREFYSDIDMLYLKVQAEDYVALSSGMNNSMFGDSLLIVPISDLDARFTVSAFYRDGLDSPAASMCRRGFEACRDEIKKRSLTLSTKGSSARNAGFTFEHFD